MNEPTGEQPQDLASRLDQLASRISAEAHDTPEPADSGDAHEDLDRTIVRSDLPSFEEVQELSPPPGQVDVPEAPALHVPDVALAFAPTPDSTSVTEEIADLRSAIEERLAVLEDSLQSVCERIESLARDGISVTGEGIEKLTENVRALEDRVTAAPAASGSSIDGERLNEVLNIIAGRIEESQELIATLANGIGDSLRAHADHLDGSLDETRGAVEVAVGNVLQAATLASGQTLASVEAPLTRAEMAEALGEIAVRLLEGQEVIADRVDYVQGHLVNESQTRETQHASLAQALVAISSASADADEVIVGETMRTSEALQSIFTEMQAQRGLLAAVVDEVRRSTQTIDSTLGGVARSLVGYLSERDRLLELERADVQREMLVGFASGLKTADRKRAVARISSALDQRADARDAQRWRDAINDPVPAAAPDVDDVATLHDLLDRFEGGNPLDLADGDPLMAALEDFPEPPAPPVRATAAKPSAKASPRATKAAPKKAPAKKTAAKAAPKPAVKAAAANKTTKAATKTPAKRASER